MPAPIRQVDWYRVVVDLNRSGYSDRRIGDELMLSKNWAWRLKNEFVQPRYEDGVALIALWSEATGRPAAECPREVPLRA